jgi:cytosine/adenosine deaminase-related metal-dependent hydrolase
MPFKKFSGKAIFTGVQLIDNNEVLIFDEKNQVVEIVPFEMAGDDIQQLNGILLPGFVNTHCHLELSHLKGLISEGTGLVQFVQQVMAQRFSTTLPEAIADAMKTQAHNMHQSGIVAVGDICNTIDSIAPKLASPIQWHNFIELTGFDTANAQQRFEHGIEKLDVFNQLFPYNTITPHAPYSISKPLFKLINEATANQIVSIHNQETLDENMLFKTGGGAFVDFYNKFNIPYNSFEPTGKSSLQSWLTNFNLHQSLLLVHNSFTTAEDIEFAAQYINQHLHTSIHYCTCILANQFIERKNPPIQMLYEKGMQLTIGTDSLASNHQLSMMHEINAIMKSVNYTIPLEAILKWATYNGAHALQLHEKLGSFEKGKKPGLVLAETDEKRTKILKTQLILA